jgi:hypothetical protein
LEEEEDVVDHPLEEEEEEDVVVHPLEEEEDAAAAEEGFKR